MFCPHCGKQLTDDSAFCDFCGSKIAGETATQPEVPREYGYSVSPPHLMRKGKVALIAIVAVALAAIVAVGGMILFRRNNDKQMIATVKNGYLGGYSDITVSEILEEDLHVSSGVVNIAWKAYEDKELGGMVAAQCTMQGEPLIIYCFRLLDEQVFEISSIGSPDLTSSDSEEMYTLLNQMYVTHYNKQGMDIDTLTEKLSNIHVAAVLYGASADYTGDRGELYLKYRKGTQLYSMADFLGLTEPDDKEISTQEKNVIIEDCLGDYYNEDGSYSLSIDRPSPGKLRISAGGYRMPVLDTDVNVPIPQTITLNGWNETPVTITFYTDERKLFVDSSLVSGWFYMEENETTDNTGSEETHQQKPDSQFWGAYDMISPNPYVTAHLEITYGSEDGQIYLSGAANNDGNTGEVSGVLEIIDNQHFRFEDEGAGVTLDMSYDPGTSVLTVNGEESAGVAFTGTYAQTSQFIDIR